jgi:hypothetical protein
LAAFVNSPGFDDGPTFFEEDEAGLGTLYFISNRPAASAIAIIWMTARLVGRFLQPASQRHRIE